MKKYFFKDEKVDTLAPHEVKTEIKWLGKGGPEAPTILLSLAAYADIQHIIETCGPDEIGWMGTVEVLEEGRYLIDKVFLFEQDVSTGHCEFEQSDVGRLYTEVIQKDGAKQANKIRFWGHLHPGDFVDASKQDEDQMLIFGQDGYFIRGIFCRQGFCKFTFFDYAHRVKIVDCPWELHVPDDARRAEIAAEIKKKVRKKFIATKWTNKWNDYGV